MENNIKDLIPYKSCNNFSRLNNNLNLERKEFLNFLTVAYKASKIPQDSIDSNFNWQNIANDVLISRLLKSFENTANKRFDNGYLEKPQENLKNFEEKNNNIRLIVSSKLKELLQDGILDSILPYMTSKNNPSGQNAGKSAIEDNADDFSKLKRNNKDKKKKSTKDSFEKSTTQSDEVEIHIFDEVKGLKKDFKCSENLLVSSMGYFEEVSKGQNLKEMDISVHCDVAIFEWLLRWIRKDNCGEHNPNLDPKNVVPIMVSAHFLQIHGLLEQCLQYWKTHMNDVIRFSQNLTCVSDNILKRLADMLSNMEIQSIRDKKDKLKSKLFCKLISALNEVLPGKLHGHYASLSDLFQCQNCAKFVTQPIASKILCEPSYISVKFNGEIVSNHLRSPKWDLNEHIKKIWSETKSWGKTYWRLWSQCHFLHCSICNLIYSVENFDCCLYHPQQPHFYPMEQFQGSNSPFGRYSCCGATAARFEIIKIPSGCMFRSHVPKLQTDNDVSIQRIVDTYPELIKFNQITCNTAEIKGRRGQLKKCYSCQLPSNPFSATCSDNNGLLESWNNFTISNTVKHKSFDESTKNPDTLCNVIDQPETSLNFECCSTGESENSGVSSVKGNFNNNEISAIKSCNAELRPLWLTKYSNRHNQDNQRDYEEITFKLMSNMLLKNDQQTKTMIHDQSSQDITKNPSIDIPINASGTYPQIEAEFREAYKAKQRQNTTRKLTL